MSTFAVTVLIETDTAEHAQVVLNERICYDEDYGFDYKIDALFDMMEVQ